jgi:hypothetical protein
VIHNAPFDHFVGNFAVRPVGDRAARLAGGFARHADDRAHLFGGQTRGLAGAGGISQAVLDAQVRQRDRLDQVPTVPPWDDGLPRDRPRAGNFGIALACGGVQDDPRSQSDLLRSRMTLDQVVERIVLPGSQFHGDRFSTRHENHPWDKEQR